MADDPRYDAATAVTGAALLGSGGTLRHHAVRRAYPKGRQPKIHALSMLRKAPKGKKQFWAGSVIGALGLPPLALGTTRLARGDVNKMAPRIVYHGASKEAAASIRYAGKLRPGASSARNEVYVSPHKKIAAAYAGRRVAKPNEAGDWARKELARRTEQNGPGHVVRMWAVGPSSEPEHRGVARAFSGSSYNPAHVHVATTKTVPTMGRLADDMAKADDKRKPGFWREGLRGTKEALGQRADSYRQPVPTKLRAAQLGVGAATGAMGSVVARAALGRRGDALKPFITPIAGGLSATGSVPLTNRVVHNRYPDYEVTPSGVRRKKKPIVMPSKMASRHRGTPRSLRQDVNKAYVPKHKMWTLDKDDLAFYGSGGRFNMRFKNRVQQQGRRQYLDHRAAKVKASTSELPLGLTDGGVYREMRKAQSRAQAIIAKADDKRYLGARTPYATQRAVTTASTHTPVVGPFVSAGTAARYAPPGQGRKAALRQWGMSSGVGIPAGIAGAYGGAHLANRSDKAHHAAHKLVSTKDKVEGKARSLVGLKEKEGLGPVGRATARFARTKAGKPFRTPRGAIGGAAGMVVARGIAGGVGDQAAITMNQNAQRRYNKLHHIEKAAGPGQTKREKHNLATQKRRTAALSTASGLLGLGSLGLIATGRRNAAVTTGILGSGIGGTNSLLSARVQRKEAQNVDPVKKRYDKGTGHWDIPKDGLVQMVGSGGKWTSAFKDRENPLLGVRYVDPEDVQDREWTRARLKAHTPFKPHRQKVRARTTNPKHVYRVRKAALEIKGSDREHHDMLRRYGDRGPLPKGLSREDRMKAYEARYVHHGGDKANAWSRRAATGNTLKNVGVGVGTAAGAAWLATRGKSGIKRLARHPNMARHAETAAVAGATVGGAGEMLAGYAHRRQSSYANSPGGVAASALRRMRAYTPETT